MQCVRSPSQSSRDQRALIIFSPLVLLVELGYSVVCRETVKPSQGKQTLTSSRCRELAQERPLLSRSSRWGCWNQISAISSVKAKPLGASDDSHKSNLSLAFPPFCPDNSIVSDVQELKYLRRKSAVVCQNDGVSARSELVRGKMRDGLQWDKNPVQVDS